eukprot:TRINITY_DN5216_c0_g1_i1.p1 TRINITY_DN5216_c0_g1~~TRINITY_DN5216_c0_g1_i1.p1  ORF type:complete len:100 (-),score=8.03 TRINITY_DN5216_c0_g1_i1:140-439(-)
MSLHTCLQNSNETSGELQKNYGSTTPEHQQDGQTDDSILSFPEDEPLSLNDPQPRTFRWSISDCQAYLGCLFLLCCFLIIIGFFVFLLGFHFLDPDFLS